jgi:hypothetical protein
MLRFAIEFEDRDKVCDHLSELLSEGRIGLFLGAGISKPMGLPDWNEFVTRLFVTKGKPQPVNLSLERQAEIFKLDCFDTDFDGYLKFLQQELYKSADTSFKKMISNNTLSAIGSLVMSSRRGSVSEVVTLNWDNLIELYLSYHGFTVQSVIDSQHWASLADVIIYHPHGFIPCDGDNFSKQLIFDQSSYSQTVGDLSKAWNQKILTLIRSKFVIFIGLSGDDFNLDSLISHFSSDHIAKISGCPFWGVTFTKNTNDPSNKIWKKRGVYPVEITDYENDLPDFLFKICQGAALKSI